LDVLTDFHELGAEVIANWVSEEHSTAGQHRELDTVSLLVRNRGALCPE
jgi:hypothetical protein